MDFDFVVRCAGKLNSIQHELFVKYGLRQIKYMFEKDPVMNSKVPDGSVLIGLSDPFMRWTAIDYENGIRYGYFKGQNPEWSEANNFNNVDKFDKVDDFRFIYETFNLIEHALDSLTNIHIEYNSK